MAPLWRESDVTLEIRVDITEGEKVHTLEAEIPGVDKRDIEVSVDGNQVSIRAERKRESREQDEKEIVVERSFGKAYRSFALPGDVDGNRTEARYDKGVLTLILPRKMDGTARRITVS
jgi:HSP20 family protein